MQIRDFLSSDAIIPDLKANSKKQALQEIAAFAAKLVDVDKKVIFTTLLERERLGTTGVGQGIAIPHGKLPQIDRIYGIFARLDKPVDFDAVDEEPVDLIFVLLAPENAGADHLTALARISRVFRRPEAISKLRGTASKEAIYAVLTEDETAAVVSAPSTDATDPRDSRPALSAGAALSGLAS